MRSYIFSFFKIVPIESLFDLFLSICWYKMKQQQASTVILKKAANINGEIKRHGFRALCLVLGMHLDISDIYKRALSRYITYQVFQAR